jgi:hypothetical protein
MDMSYLAGQINPAKVLHYKGNRVLHFDRFKIVGPDMDGGYWKPTTTPKPT